MRPFSPPLLPPMSPSTIPPTWPPLAPQEHAATYAALHLWSQVVGKIRLAQMPQANHWWNVPLYVTCRGLSTSPMPYAAPDGPRVFHIDFDFLRHELRLGTSTGLRRAFPLEPLSVADFYRQTMEALRALGVEVAIWPRPVEIEDPVPFEDDTERRAYDPAEARRCWRALVQADRVFKRFSTRFQGKASPVHFFWGAFDLAVTRFSGRAAPPHPGGIPNVGDFVMREAYSHEVSSAGFWPGGVGATEALFYSYAYPAPDGFAERSVEPEAAYYHDDLQEFVLPYDAVRTAADPDAALLAFLQSTYEAAADGAGWDRAALERTPGAA